MHERAGQGVFIVVDAVPNQDSGPLTGEGPGCISASAITASSVSFSRVRSAWTDVVVGFIEGPTPPTSYKPCQPLTAGSVKEALHERAQ